MSFSSLPPFASCSSRRFGMSSSFPFGASMATRYIAILAPGRSLIG